MRTKLKKTVYSSGNADIALDYVSGFIYRNDFSGDPFLSFFPMSEGRVVSTGSSYDYHYFLKDHLGNVRVVFSGNNGEVKERNFYYPFGTTAKLGAIVGDENKIKYNSKEYEDDHGLNWYHYGARYYDPALGMWHTMDPADEFNSPYLYVGNNPINIIDPDGAQVKVAAKIWNDERMRTDFINSMEFRVLVMVSGEGGPLHGKFPVEFKVDKSLGSYPGITDLFYNRINVIGLSNNGIWKVPNGGSFNNKIRLNPGSNFYYYYDNKKSFTTLNHELAHTAYNIKQYYLSQKTESDILMWTGGFQHGGALHSQYDTGMTDDIMPLFNLDIKTLNNLTEKDIYNKIEIIK